MATWTSLEVVKIIVGVLTPLTVALVAALLARRAGRLAEKRNDAAAHQAQALARYSKVVEKRVALWDALGPKLNEIYSFNVEVGNWQRLKATDIVTLKRDCDRTFYSYRPFFSQAFADAYLTFMRACFRMFTGVGEDAKLRTSNDHHKDPEPNRFTGEDNRSAIHNAYFALVDIVASELDLAVTTPPPPKPPAQPQGPSGQ